MQGSMRGNEICVIALRSGRALWAVGIIQVRWKRLEGF